MGVVALICTTALLLTAGRRFAALEATYDDALFLRTAASLLEGRWLGTYDHVTLSKGPGYPLFMAALHALGIPLAPGERLLQIAAGLALVQALRGLIPSAWPRMLLLALYLFDPSNYTSFLGRAVREGIYPAQVVLIFAGAIGVFTSILERREAPLGRWAALLGVCTGWYWITREEGIWIAPALGLMFIATAVTLWRQRPGQGEDRTRLWPRLLWAPIGAAAVLLATASANARVYGSFVTNEVREGAFARAYSAVIRVQDPLGRRIDYVPLPRSARMALYRESAAFKELERSLEREWISAACHLNPSTCGEIGGAHLMWALRTAASSAGHFRSASDAATFFARLAGEVEQACADGRVRCGRPTGSMLPRLHREHWQRLPAAIRDVIAVLAHRPPLSVVELHSVGGPEYLTLFRDTTLCLPAPREGDEKPRLLVRGWIHQSGAPAPSLALRTASDEPVDSQVTWLESPDVVRFFDDPRAGRSRFELAGPCDLRCRLQVNTQVGAFGTSAVGLRRRLRSGQKLLLPPPVPPGLLGYVESVEVLDVHRPRPVPVALQNAMGCLAVLYGWVIAPLAALALCAWAATTSMLRRHAPARPLWIVATALLLALAARVALLALIEVTSFSAANPWYLSPAYPLLDTFIVLSWPALASWRDLVRRPETGGRPRAAC
jgi:hypothetical protein